MAPLGGLNRSRIRHLAGVDVDHRAGQLILFRASAIVPGIPDRPGVASVPVLGSPGAPLMSSMSEFIVDSSCVSAPFTGLGHTLSNDVGMMGMTAPLPGIFGSCRMGSST